MGIKPKKIKLSFKLKERNFMFRKQMELNQKTKGMMAYRSTQEFAKGGVPPKTKRM